MNFSKSRIFSNFPKIFAEDVEFTELSPYQSVFPLLFVKILVKLILHTVKLGIVNYWKFNKKWKQKKNSFRDQARDFYSLKLFFRF